MPANEDFSVPPPKRRRTSSDSSNPSSRSYSPSREIPLRGRDGLPPARAEDSREPYTRSRSRADSEENEEPYSPRESQAEPINHRRRDHSQTSDYSRSAQSRSISRPRRRQSHTVDSQNSRHTSPLAEPTQKLSFKPLYNISRAHGRGITTVKFSPDLSLLAVGSADASITIYSMTQPIATTTTTATTSDQPPPLKLLRTLRAHLAGINTLAWSPVGPNYTLASGSDDKSILLWTPLSSDFPISPSPLTGHSNYVYSLAFSPKGNMLVSGSYDEAVFLWDVRSARIMRQLPAHSDPVSGVDFLRDGSMVCSCAEDGLIRIWDSGTGQCLKTLVDEDRKPVSAVRFTPNGKFVVAWTLDGCIRLWRYTEGTCVKTYTGHVNTEYSLCGAIGEYMAGREAFLVSGSEDGELVAWDVTSKEVLWRGKGHEDVVLSVDFGKLKDGRGLLVSAGKDRDVRLWIEDVEPRVDGYGGEGEGEEDGEDVKEAFEANGEDEGGDVVNGDADADAGVGGGDDPMVVDVDITQTPGGEVKIEETVV